MQHHRLYQFVAKGQIGQLVLDLPLDPIFPALGYGLVWAILRLSGCLVRPTKSILSNFYTASETAFTITLSSVTSP